MIWSTAEKMIICAFCVSCKKVNGPAQGWYSMSGVNHLFNPHSLVLSVHAMWGIWNYLHAFFLTLWCPKLILFVVASFKSPWRSSDALADCLKSSAKCNALFIYCMKLKEPSHRFWSQFHTILCWLSKRVVKPTWRKYYYFFFFSSVLA